MKKFLCAFAAACLAATSGGAPVLTLDSIKPVESKLVEPVKIGQAAGLELKPNARLRLAFDGEKMTGQGTVIFAFVPDQSFGTKSDKAPDVLLQIGDMHWKPNSLSMVREPDGRIILTLFGETTRTFGEFSGGLIRKGQINTAAISWDGERVHFFLNDSRPAERNSPAPIHLGKDRFAVGSPIQATEKWFPAWNFTGKIAGLEVDDSRLPDSEISAKMKTMRGEEPPTVLEQGKIRAEFDRTGGLAALTLDADGRKVALPVDPARFWTVELERKNFTPADARFLGGKLERNADGASYTTRHEFRNGDYTVEFKYTVRAAEGDRLRVGYSITGKPGVDNRPRIFLSRIEGLPSTADHFVVQAYRHGMIWRADKLPDYTSRPAPGQMWMQFSGWYGPEGAALFYVEDHLGYLKFNFHGKNRKGVFLGWYEDALLDGDKSYQIPYDYVIAPLARADYHDFARIYGEWARRQPWAQVKAADKLAARPELAKHISNGIIKVCGFESMGGRSFVPYERKLTDCRLSLTYDQAAGYMKKFEELYGVQPGYRFDAWYGPHDARYPDLLPVADRIGGMDGLRRFLDFTRANRMPVTYYVNPSNYDEEAPSYRITKSVRGRNMEPNAFSFWSGSRLRWVSPKFMIEDNVPVLKELEKMGLYGGIFFDQLGGASPYIDMNEHAGYEYFGRDSNHRGNCAAFRAFRTAFPKFLIGTEDGQEQMLDSFDFAEAYARGGNIEQSDRFADGRSWIPLNELVYGDCFFNLMGIDGNNIVTADARRVIRVLYATAQGCSMRGEIEYLPVRHAEFERNDVIGEFATRRMLRHLIDPAGWRASIYDNGVIVGNLDGGLCDAAVDTPIGRVEVRRMRPSGFAILTANGKFVLWGVGELRLDGKLLAAVENNSDTILTRNSRGIHFAGYGFVGAENRDEPYKTLSKEPWRVTLPGVDFSKLKLTTFPAPVQSHPARIAGETVTFAAPGAEKSLWLR